MRRISATFCIACGSHWEMKMVDTAAVSKACRLVAIAPELLVGHHVDFGIGADIVGISRANLEKDSSRRPFVDQVVAVGRVLRKRDAIACGDFLFAGIGDQGDFARNHINKFIVAGMPMTLTRPRTGRQPREIDTVLRQTARIAKRLFDALLCLIVIGRKDRPSPSVPERI
jgi:hypothetical protein